MKELGGIARECICWKRERDREGELEREYPLMRVFHMKVLGW